MTDTEFETTTSPYWQGFHARDVEVANLKANLKSALRIAQEANDDCRTLLAERDALQAQLDNMTVEFQGWPDSPTFSKRLVGPWVEVTD